MQGNLVLMRREKQAVEIILPDGTHARVKVDSVKRGKVKLSFNFPQGIGIWREEMLAANGGTVAG